MAFNSAKTSLNSLVKDLTLSFTWILESRNAIAASFLCGVIFFAVFLSLFPSGYGINDDMKIIPLVAGYPTGNPVPFLVYENVILGFLLVRLHQLPTDLNWQVLLFMAVQFVSVWLLCHQIASSSQGPARKIFGLLIVVTCEAYFTLRITFTTTAAFAGFAGLCGLLHGARSDTQARDLQAWVGGALLLSATLIRDKMVPVVLAIALPYVVLSWRALDVRRLATSFLATGLLALASILFNRVYVRTSPAWNTYYLYNSTRQLLHDTHRIQNLGRATRRVGWSPNDQEVFARWYFPGDDTYSLERLQFLVRRVSPWSSSPSLELVSLVRAPFAPSLLPYLLLAAASVLLMRPRSSLRTTMLPVGGVWLVCLAVNAYLALAWKITDRTVIVTFAEATLLTFLIPLWRPRDAPAAKPEAPLVNGGRRWTRYAGIATLAAAVALALIQFSRTATTQREREALYRRAVDEIAGLQQNGILQPGALILSPAHGLPLEWSNPFRLQLPTVTYFDMGWLTFSPVYEEVLSSHGISDFPEALYQNRNVYLMTRANILPYMARSFEEHQGMDVGFRSLYDLPNPSRLPGYEDVHLYQVVALEPEVDSGQP